MTNENLNVETKTDEFKSTEQAFSQMANQFDAVQMPEWDRAAMLPEQPTRSIFVGVVPGLSLAFSCFALFMVLFNAKVTWSDDQIELSFNQADSSVIKQLEEYKSQQVMLLRYMDDVENRQLKQTSELVSLIMENNQQNRREDMKELLEYINFQREEDLKEMKYQLRQTAWSLNAQSTHARPSQVGDYDELETGAEE